MRASAPDIEQLLADKRKIETVLLAAVREALVRHKRAANPVAVWRDGKVEWVAPDRLEISDERAA